MYNNKIDNFIIRAKYDNDKHMLDLIICLNILMSDKADHGIKNAEVIIDIADFEYGGKTRNYQYKKALKFDIYPELIMMFNGVYEMSVYKEFNNIPIDIDIDRKYIIDGKIIINNMERRSISKLRS